MKNLINPKITVSADGKTATIIAEIEDRPFNSMLTTRVTHGHINPENMQHGRHIQSSNEAVFVKSRHGGIAIHNDFIVAVAAAIDPMTTFAPIFKKSDKWFSVEVVSETPVTFQWEISDDAFPKGTFPPPQPVWTSIENANLKTIDESLVKSGQWVRCKAKNSTGETISQPFQKV